MGCNPRIISIVRSTDVWVYIVLSTVRRLTHGETTHAGARWESTWSGPFCASSSMMKIAVSFQKRLFDTASTSIPTP